MPTFHLVPQLVLSSHPIRLTSLSITPVRSFYAQLYSLFLTAQSFMQLFPV